MNSTYGFQTDPLTGLLSLPDELLLAIAEFIPSQRDLARFLRVNRRLHVTLRDLLLQRNIKHSNSSVLMWAVRNNHVEVVFRMVRLKADLWTSCHDEIFGSWVLETPLQRAVKNGNLRLVKILTKEKTQEASQAPKQVDKIQRLRAKIGCKQSLHLALERKNERIARVLANRLEGIDTVINIDRSTRERKTALHTACDNRLVEATRYLLSKGADPNWQFEGGLCFRYVESLLDINDEFRRRVDDGAIEILQLLFSYGLKPDRRLRKIGNTHSDPRVRWLFGDRTVRSQQSKPKAATEESLAIFFENLKSFPPIASNSSRKTLTSELHSVWAALTDMEYRASFLKHLTKTEKRLEVSETDSSAADVDPFPPLCLVCPEMNEEAKRRWADFKRMEQHRRQIFEASQPRCLEMRAFKRPEPQKESFPALSSNIAYTNKDSSEIWANYRRRGVSPARTDSTPPITMSTMMKTGRQRKTKWKKVFL